MIQGYNTADVNVDHEALDAERARSEGVSTGLTEILSDVGLDIGVWEHSVGSSRDTFGAEAFVVLSGRGRVRCDNGGVIELAPGVIGVLHEGDMTTWEIDEPLRKVWIVASGD